MIKEYTISGMSCNSCVAKVENSLNAIKEVENIEVQLTSPQAKITFSNNVDFDHLSNLVGNAGNFTLSEIKQTTPKLVQIEDFNKLPEKSLKVYKPLFLIVLFIAGVSLLAQYPFYSFSGMLWMRHFMAGFFIVFAFFKLLNLNGFSTSYRMYDVIAAKWNTWGFIYPFLELGLGILYLINLFPLETNVTTAILLGIGTIGVVESNINKRKIKCACLGDVFNLPMSTVTIIENVSMMLMAILMLFWI